MQLYIIASNGRKHSYDLKMSDQYRALSCSRESWWGISHNVWPFRGACICSEESKRKQKIFGYLSSIDLNSTTFYEITAFGEEEENVRGVVSFNEILAWWYMVHAWNAIEATSLLYILRSLSFLFPLLGLVLLLSSVHLVLLCYSECIVSGNNAESLIRY